MLLVSREMAERSLAQVVSSHLSLGVHLPLSIAYSSSPLLITLHLRLCLSCPTLSDCFSFFFFRSLNRFPLVSCSSSVVIFLSSFRAAYPKPRSLLLTDLLSLLSSCLHLSLDGPLPVCLSVCLCSVFCVCACV